MKSRKRAYSIALCCLLAVTVLLPGLVFLFAGATAADDQEESLLGTLSAQFEASSPGMVSSGRATSAEKVLRRLSVCQPL